MKRDDGNPTSGPPGPHVDPRVATVSPQAAKYLQSKQLRKSPPSAFRPEGMSVPIPRLDLAPEELGVPAPMAAHAAVQRQHFTAPTATAPVGSICGGAPGGSPVAAPPAGSGVQPGDLLPPSAKEDPEFRPGINSEYAINQPGLAQKHGVIRGGQYLPPTVLRGGKQGQLSSATLEGLNAIRELQEQQKVAAQTATEASIAASAKGGLGDIASKIAEPMRTSTLQERIEKIEEAHDKKQIDSFEYEKITDMVTRDMLNNSEEREAVESRLTPLRLDDLVRDGFVRQRVPIIPGVFEPTFVSYDGFMDSEVKRIIFEERYKAGRPDLQEADRYYIDRFSVMALTVSLEQVNEVLYPRVTDAEGNFDEAKFKAKLLRVLRLPFHMITSLSIHLQWFDLRVRRLFQVSNLKNS